MERLLPKWISDGSGLVRVRVGPGPHNTQVGKIKLIKIAALRIVQILWKGPAI